MVRFLLALILTAAGLVTSGRAQDPEACVRVHAGNSLGSGTVFYRGENGDAFILTNHHVAGRKGSRVTIDFWNDGKLQPAVPGMVVEAQIDKAWTDVAIIRVQKSDLGQLDPPFIPLAPPDTQVVEGEIICSRGCPDGVWQCQFVGCAKQSHDLRIEFYPRPGAGRSGSAVLVKEKNEIAGLLTWSTGIPKHESHGTDGYDNRSGNGIAQPINHVWRVIRGQASIDDAERPEHVRILQCDDENRTQILRRPRRRPLPMPGPLPGPGWEQPQGPIDPAPLPPMDGPSSGPEAQPELQPEPAPQLDEDGLLKRRFGPPKAEPEDEPKDDGVFFRRQPSERPGLLAWLFAPVLKLFWGCVYICALVGAWTIFSKLRGVNLMSLFKSFLNLFKSPPAASIVLLCALATSAFAQEPSAAYLREMENNAQRWAATETSILTDRWGCYEDAFEESIKDKKPLLVYISMPGCRPCKALKQELDRADRYGLLEDIHTCAVELGRDDALIEKFKPEAYPTLIAYKWDAEKQQYARAATKTGMFSAKLEKAEPQADGGLTITIHEETLDAWLEEAGLN